MKSKRQQYDDSLIDRFIFKHFDAIKQQIRKGPYFFPKREKWVRREWFANTNRINFNTLAWDYPMQDPELDTRVNEAIYLTFGALLTHSSAENWEMVGDRFKTAVYLSVNAKNEITDPDKYVMQIQNFEMALNLILFQLGILEFRDDDKYPTAPTTKQIKGVETYRDGTKDRMSKAKDIMYHQVSEFLKGRFEIVFGSECKCMSKYGDREVTYTPVHGLITTANAYRNNELHNAFRKDPAEAWNNVVFLLYDLITVVFFLLRSYEIDMDQDVLSKASKFIEANEKIEVEFARPATEKESSIAIRERHDDNQVPENGTQQVLQDGTCIVSFYLKRDFEYTLVCDGVEIDFSTNGFFNHARVNVDYTKLNRQTLKPEPNISGIIYDPIFNEPDQDVRRELLNKLSHIADKELADKMLVILGLKEGPDRDELVARLKNGVLHSTSTKEIISIIEATNNQTQACLQNYISEAKEKEAKIDLSDIKLDRINESLAKAIEEVHETYQMASKAAEEASKAAKEAGKAADVGKDTNSVAKHIEKLIENLYRLLHNAKYLAIAITAVCVLIIAGIAVYRHTHTPQYLYAHGKYEAACDAGHPLAALQLARMADSAGDYKAAGEWWKRAYSDISSAFAEDSANTLYRRALTEMYRYGRGVEQNHVEAATILQAIKDSTASDFGLYSYLLYKAGKEPTLIAYEIANKKAVSDSVANDPHLLLTEALLKINGFRMQQNVDIRPYLQRIDSLANTGMADANLESIRLQMEAIKTFNGDITLLPKPSSMDHSLKIVTQTHNIPEAWELKGDWLLLLGADKAASQCYLNAIYAGRKCHHQYAITLIKDDGSKADIEEYLRNAEAYGNANSSIVRLLRLQQNVGVDSAVYVSKLLDIPGVEQFAIYVARDLINFGAWDVALSLFHKNGRTDINLPYLMAYRDYGKKDAFNYVVNLYRASLDGCESADLLLGNHCMLQGGESVDYAKFYYTRALSARDSTISSYAALYLNQFGDSTINEKIQNAVRGRTDIAGALADDHLSPVERIAICARLLFNVDRHMDEKQILAFCIAQSFDEMDDYQTALEWYAVAATDLDFPIAYVSLMRCMLRFEDDTNVACEINGLRTSDVFVKAIDTLTDIARNPGADKGSIEKIMVDIARTADSIHKNNDCVNYLAAKGIDTSIIIPEDFSYNIPILLYGSPVEF